MLAGSRTHPTNKGRVTQKGRKQEARQADLQGITTNQARQRYGAGHNEEQQPAGTWQTRGGGEESHGAKGKKREQGMWGKGTVAGRGEGMR